MNELETTSTTAAPLPPPPRRWLGLRGGTLVLLLIMFVGLVWLNLRGGPDSLLPICEPEYFHGHGFGWPDPAYWTGEEYHLLVTTGVFQKVGHPYSQFLPGTFFYDLLSNLALLFCAAVGLEYLGNAVELRRRYSLGAYLRRVQLHLSTLLTLALLGGLLALLNFNVREDLRMGARMHGVEDLEYVKLKGWPLPFEKTFPDSDNHFFLPLAAGMDAALCVLWLVAVAMVLEWRIAARKAHKAGAAK